MVFRKLYYGFQDIDARVLKFYRKYAERWEARGHGRYGLPCLMNTVSKAAIGVYPVDFVLSFEGFLLTTPEPEKGLWEDMRSYSIRFWGYDVFNFEEFYNHINKHIGIKNLEKRDDAISLLRYFELGFSRTAVFYTTPFRKLLKRGLTYDLIPAEGVAHDVMKSDPLFKAMWNINTHARLPMLIAGIGLMGKAVYSFAYALYTREPVWWQGVETDISLGSGFVLTATSAYFKDGDNPSLGEKQKSLKELLQSAYAAAKEKVTIRIPNPVPTERRTTLEDLV